jgi:glyoxylase-like metal-dependent hydrolase (beta-lactamase superfamily II)
MFRMGQTTLNNLLRAGAVAGVMAAGILPATVGFAAAPMAKTQAPGYYRVMLGDFEVTALSDGSVGLPVDKLLTNVKPAELKKGLAWNYLGIPTETSVNGFLINTGDKLVLIDTGAAGLFGPTLGKLTASLKAAGYQPEQVDEIYLTHLHPDHVGGLMAGDQMVFPNAIVRCDQREADFWLSQANLDKAPADAKGFFQGAMASLNPYVKAGKFKGFTGNTELLPGFKAVSAIGHTAGHTVYMVESKGKKLIVWGDLIHVGSVQFPDPNVTIAFDTDSKAALAQRKKIFAMVARDGVMVAAAHLSFPGLGHIRAQGKGYSWIPTNYESAPK